MMKLNRLVVLVVLAGAIAGGLLAADAPTTPAAKPAVAQETAVFAVPGLDQVATVKALSKALAEKTGIVAAKVDKEKGQYAVTFETARTNPDEILKALAPVAPTAKLEKVVPAEGKTAAKPDCSQCPSRSGCGTKHE
ncbi:MAG TPA: heavy-metal-associated domain-containing protein [Acidobacteriota bacterium]|nr:hypothetical protein [Acidobacteriota bacterium]HOT00590.1 heavy-metal-associated domain-containing protein [Acidobacteriota bacterium]HQF87275.1 heavy-metal-associated domain-containing protein [Acidobacteriota bacterium]HQG91849.1 heavy-metal-associated domain-containing protein [Acidobacteriota bacterium]